MCQVHPEKQNCEEYLVTDARLSVVSNIHFCTNGSYISQKYLCDGKVDCAAFPNDELNCSCFLGKITKDSQYCCNRCHPSNCTCSNLYQQIHFGGCRIYEENYENKANTLIEPAFNCSNSTMIYLHLVNDLIPDCLDAKDENILLMFRVTHSKHFNYSCTSMNMSECYPGHPKCYHDEDKCQYALNKITKTLTICRNGKHLENCEYMECITKHKCPKSYCVPYGYICDGK